MRNTEVRLWDYLNRIRGFVHPEQYLNASVIMETVKEEIANRDADPNEIYAAVLRAADRMRVQNPFPDEKAAYSVYHSYLEIEEMNWEELLAQTLKDERYPVLAEAVVKLYEERMEKNPAEVMIAEAEKFAPNLEKFIDAHMDSKYVLTSMNVAYAELLERIFKDYDNVEVVNTEIYRYEFIDRRFDLILSSPAFGGRTLVDDQPFICREYDMVALENLSLHLNNGGELVITLPGKITFGSGRIGDLRQFIQENYTIKEIGELPEGTFEFTGIKTYLLDLVNARPEDDDIVIRKYATGERKNKRDSITELTVADDTFIFRDELEEQGDWNINRFFEMQDDEWLKYQNSGTRKEQLGNVAEVFRGKNVSKKDPNGRIGIINISNVGNYEVDYSNLDHFDEEDRKVQNYLLQDGDLLLPARGTAIRTAVFKDPGYPCIAFSNLIVIRPDERQLNSTYLKIFLDSPLGNKLIGSLQQGSTIMNISYKDLQTLEVPVPTLEEQEKVASEYDYELNKYKESIAAAENRWKGVLGRLQEF